MRAESLLIFQSQFMTHGLSKNRCQLKIVLGSKNNLISSSSNSKTKSARSNPSNSQTIYIIVSIKNTCMNNSLNNTR